MSICSTSVSEELSGALSPDWGVGGAEFMVPGESSSCWLVMTSEVYEEPAWDT